MLQRQKFTEPVALSSASPGNFRPSALRLLPTALRSDFDLLALRARCKGKRTRSDRSRQEGRRLEKHALCEPALGKSCGFPGSSVTGGRARRRLEQSEGVSRPAFHNIDYRARREKRSIGWFGSPGTGLDESSVATETDILLLSDDLRQLVDAAEERGSLLQSELNDVLEPLSLDPLETDSVYRELETRQIDVMLDVGEDGEIAARAKREPQPPLQISWETTTDALQLFLREAGRHPLLTAAQEVELAKKIEASDMEAKQRMI